MIEPTASFASSALLRNSSKAENPPRRSYSEKLKDARWQKLRLRLFNQARWTCQECGKVEPEDGLHVHHIIYLTGVEPWDHPDTVLMVLCEAHHKERQALDRIIFTNVAEVIRNKSIAELKKMPICWMFDTRPLLGKEARA